MRIEFPQSTVFNKRSANINYNELFECEVRMMNEKKDTITSGDIAKELGVSDGKVKKAIKELGIEPQAKKGVCNYYSRDALAKIKEALRKS
jgi:hypothetical protein